MFNRLKQLGLSDEGVIGIARLLSVYMVAGGGYTMAGGGGPPSAATTIAKCLPIVCLSLLTGQKAWNGCIYAAFITLGLLLSAVGDALLVWDQLAAGMALFAVALLVYTSAMPTTPLLPVRGVVAAVIAVGVVSQLRAPASVAPLVPPYALCVWLAVWRGGAARLLGPERGTIAMGLEMFALSDAVLACHMFYMPLPFHQLIVMGSYYTAQLLIALSTYPSDPPTPKDVKAQ